jgi:5-methylthioadenosine/S-adenosylhomocysteine deaminase
MSSTATEAPIAQSVSALTIHGHLFTMKGDGVGYVAHGAVAINGGRILAAGPTEELTRRYTAEEVFDATDCAVLPGLIDAHMHTPLAIVRGVAQNVAHWMQRALAPYTRHPTDSARLSGCRLNALQALKAGTTTHVDYSLPFPGWMEFYAPLGVQARITPMINARPPGAMAGWKLGDLYPLGDRVGQALIEEAFEIARHWQGAEGGRVTVMIGPQAPDMFSREQLMQVKRMAQREGLMIRMHVALGCREVDQMLKRFGQRTTA